VQNAPETPLWNVIGDMASRSITLLVKKLSRNDVSWADDRGKHQAGFYVPSEIRTSGFFPNLHAAVAGKPHIFRAGCPTVWPQTGEITQSNLSHYSNKGSEAHFTVVPRVLFQGLSPASWLVGGRFDDDAGEPCHWFVTVDSASEEAELLETALDLNAQFHFALFDPRDLLQAPGAFPQDEISSLIEEIRTALRSGTLNALLAQVSALPEPAALAHAAQQQWMKEEGRSNLNPFDIEAPGDALMRISRDLEYRIYRRYELRRRAVEVIRILIREPDQVSSVVHGFSELDAVFLSASQQRKTRAGRSFEGHIAAMLRAGSIRFSEQAVTGGRRPDFVLPDARTFKLGHARTYNEALVLSAKTTLRERWKQVSREGFNCAVFLATVDDRVPDAAIKEMASDGIGLVVPESLIRSNETCYAKQSSVISFRSFFRDEVRAKRKTLLVSV
jgi:hypothetical protein